jgi:aminoglycoside phosphotransferase (APT) family kinase protein
MVATSGHVAAALHTSGVGIGPPRTLDDELAGLQREIAVVRPFGHAFAERARAWLEQIAALAGRSEPLLPRLSHGDFKHEQLLVDGRRNALVDFDAICQAEPGLDLGKFLAHLRVEAGRIQQRASLPSRLGDDLSEQFLRAYVSAANDQLEDEGQVRVRTALYEAVALLRLTIRSQQNLDEAGRELTASVLEASLAGEFEQR